MSQTKQMSSQTVSVSSVLICGLSFERMEQGEEACLRRDALRQTVLLQ